MPSPLVEKFMSALQSAEALGDPRVVASLFGEDAELSNLTAHGPRRGPEGAVRFWAEYLQTFGQIRSHFGNVMECDGMAVLEWTSDGTFPDGRPVRYRGVSILETDGNQVRRFRSYYDTAALLGGAAGARSAAGRSNDEWAPGAVKPTPKRSGATSVEDINRQTQPRTADGKIVDPKQEEVRDTAG
jgi:ketosteroid isomerase-like protein